VILRTSPDDFHVCQSEDRRDLTEKACPTKLRIEKRHTQIWTKECENDARQTGSGPYVTDIRTRRHQWGDHAAVQQMPLPEAAYLSWPQQPPLYPSSGEQFRVPFNGRDMLTEKLSALLGGRQGFT